jgi:Subtilase family
MTRTRLNRRFAGTSRLVRKARRALAAGVAVLLTGGLSWLVGTLPGSVGDMATLLSITTPAFAGHDDSNDEMQRQQREADKEARRQQREAEKQAVRAQHEADRVAREQQREVDRQARLQQHEAEKQAIRAQHEADRAVREQQRQDRGRDQPPVASRVDTPAPTLTKTETPRTDTVTGSPQAETPKSADNGTDKKNDDGTAKDKKDERVDGAKEKDDTPEITYSPPPTLEKWLKGLVSTEPVPAAVAKPRAVEATPVVVKPQTGKSAPAPAAAAAGKTQTATPSKPANPKAAPRGSGTIEPIALPDLATPDILALNASRQTLDRAKALGFTARPATSFANLAFAVTSLQPPPGMSSTEARALLNRELPGGSFAANKKYRIYRTASGTDKLQPGTRAATIHPASGPPDCNGDHCFGREAIGWKPELRTCVSGMRIGIIDTSVDVSHPAFARKKLELKHFGNEAAALGPDWHGTGVTALLAGDSSSGTPGMIPDANFYIADIFHADGDQEPASDTVSMLRAFDWLDAKGVKIINMSLSGPPDELILKAIERLSAKGTLFVAAAGNEGPTAGPSYPAAYEQVIAVTAVNKDLQGYRYANRGNYIDVAAPGVAIWTALPGSLEGFHSGTSFATPYVTAALAALYPSLTSKTHDEALKHIQYKDLGEPGRDVIFGQGLLVAPSSCSGPQVANAPAPAPASKSASTPPQGVGASSETLPWLGLQNTSN